MGQGQHVCVGSDQPVPRPVILMKREHHFPIVESRHSLVDLGDWNELGLDDVLSEHVDDWLREVLIEREQPAHAIAAHAASRRFALSSRSRSIASSMASEETVG